MAGSASPGVRDSIPRRTGEGAAPDRALLASCRFHDHNRPTCDTESEGATAAAAEHSQLATLRDQTTPTGEEITGASRIGTLGERWLRAIIADADVAPQTIDRYEASLRTVILPKLGDLRVRERTVGRLARPQRSGVPNLGLSEL